MPEPFKNLFNCVLINALACHLQRAAMDIFDFDREGFVERAASGLESLELKARSRQVTQALCEYLPADFAVACEILLKALHPEEDAPLSEQVMNEYGVRGWAIMPMADFVAHNGLQYFDLSLNTLAQMTKRFSAEFAVRPFIIHDLERAEAYLQKWAGDQNVHVRRLASEGARPRLPWGAQIPALIENPQPTLPVLEVLRDDPSDYVRKSVANHLNDIAKDHPHIVVQVAKRWLEGAPLARQRLIRHACRTLIKQGNVDIMRVLGYSPAQLGNVQFSLSSSTVEIGGVLELQLSVSNAHSTQALLLDYIMHFRLANGRLGKKVFKWKSLTLAAGETITLCKQHVFRPITTRTLYPGMHKVQLQLNGLIVAEQSFSLCPSVPN